MDKVVENIGKKIYKNHKYYRDLATVMEHPEFRNFFDSYMKDVEDAKLTIMFMKLYEAIEKRSNVELSPYQKIAIMKEMMDDWDFRRAVVMSEIDPPHTMLAVKDT